MFEGGPPVDEFPFAAQITVGTDGAAEGQAFAEALREGIAERSRPTVIDVVVTRDGCEVLSSGVPKTVAEIEALMASSGG